MAEVFKPGKVQNAPRASPFQAAGSVKNWPQTPKEEDVPMMNEDDDEM